MNDMTHAEYAAFLRAAADFWEAHPEIKLPYTQQLDYAHLDEKEEAAAVMRALGACEKIYNGEYFHIRKKMGAGALDFLFYRSKVCTRKVVGVETQPAIFVEAHTIPAKTVEIVEWDCEPILATEDGEEEAAA